MKPAQFLELVLLAALWGASFLFMLWGMLALDESETLNMLAGTVIILAGTAPTAGLAAIPTARS